jgi:hypothetical protein
VQKLSHANECGCLTGATLRLMRNLKTASLLLLATTVLLASNILAQTDNSQASNELSIPIVAARCQYMPADHACAGVSDSAGQRNASDGGTLAQLPRRGPGPPFRPRGPMGRASYPGMWRSEGSPAHALIGTLIGFGLGAAVGAKGNIGVRGSLVFGAIGAGIGAGMGFSVPSFPSRNRHWRRWPDEDEEASGRKTAKPAATQPNWPPHIASADPTPPRPLARAEVAVSPTLALR